MGLGKYIARKTLYSVILLLLIVAFNFVLFQILPFVIGCPDASYVRCAEALYVPEQPPRGVINASEWHNVIRIKILHAYGFDKPLWPTYANGTVSPGRFINYYGNMFTFNFGYNLGAALGGPVIDSISNRAPYTLLLLGSSTVSSFAIGIGLGVVASAKRGKVMDVSSLGALLFLNALPVFFLGGMLEILSLGLTGKFYVPLGTALIGNDSTWDVYVILIKELFLPFLTLTLAGVGGVFLTQRAVMIDTLSEDYIVMARAKGVPERTVLYKHALRNAVLPIVTALALSIGFILSGAIITETVFSWPGLGYATYLAVTQSDFPFAQAIFFIITSMVLVAVFAADIAYGFLDPRVSRE